MHMTPVRELKVSDHITVPLGFDDIDESITGVLDEVVWMDGWTNPRRAILVIRTTEDWEEPTLWEGDEVIVYPVPQGVA